jgi:hypothetical protein
MINDPDHDPRFKRLRDSLPICGATVNGKQKFNAILHRRSECALGYAVPVCVAIRNVALCNGTDRTKCSNDDRCAREAICVEIADNEHRLALGACRSKAGDQTCSIWKECGVV